MTLSATAKAVPASSSALKDRHAAVANPGVWRDKLALLLESTGDGIFGIDLEGCCTFINRAACEQLGYTAEQAFGRNMHDLIHHTHLDGAVYPSCDCPIFRAFRQGLPCRIDSEVLWRADGTAFTAEYSSHAIIEKGMVCGAVVTFVDISERRQADALLREAKERLEQHVVERTHALSDALAQVRDLSAHLLTVREDERTRIAREIHDEFGSLLIALKLDVNWLRKRLDFQPPLAEKCDSMGRLIEVAVDSVGRIITDLRPSLLDHQGLSAALEWHFQEFAESTQLACEIFIDADECLSCGIDALDDARATAIFRICQEMLSNVARHAQADRVQLRVSAVNNEITLEVADNGRGAAARAFEKSDAHGVLGMRERALYFGGRVQILSAPGQGTRAILTMPLGNTPPDDESILPALANPERVHSRSAS